MNRHGWWMIIGCTLPLLLIFLAPAVGLDQNWGLFLFIGLMLLCHLGMMGMHGGRGDHRGRRRPPTEDNTEDDVTTKKEPDTHGTP